jgi:hypothetical protein
MRTWYAIVAHLPVSSWNNDSRSSAAKLWKTFPLGSLKPIVSGRRNAGRPASRISFEYCLDVLPERLADALHGSKILPSQDSAVVGVGRTAEVPGNGSELRNGAP